MRIVIKFGGSLIDDQAATDKLLRQVVRLQQQKTNDIYLVHGGGARINQALEDAGIVPKFDKGLRVTDDATMEIVSRVLVEEINKDLVKAIEKAGGKAIGSDKTRIIHSIPLRDNENNHKNNQQQDRLGRPEKIDKIQLNGVIAVIPPVGKDIISGLDYNVNADWAAAAIAIDIMADELIYLTDQDGILGADNKVLPEISSDEINTLIEQGVITDGMIPKVLSLQEALSEGVKNITITTITRSSKEDSITAVIKGQAVGTRLHL